MRKLTFIEFQEFVCRMASATFALDKKVVEKAKSPAMLYMVDMQNRSLAVQVAAFLNVWLPNLIPNEQREEFYYMMPSFDQVMIDLGVETGDNLSPT